MIKRKFRFAVQFLAVVLVAIGVMNFCKEIRPVRSMAEESAYEEVVKYPITETDVHNGINVKKYASYYGATVDINDERANNEYFTVHGDDAIVNFIPRELFKTVGQTFYVGREYGFLVDTIDLKNGNGGSHRGFNATLISFKGLSSAAIRFDRSAPQRLQRWTIAHSPPFLTHTAIGSITPPQSEARSPGCSSRCRLQRQLGQ